MSQAKLSAFEKFTGHAPMGGPRCYRIIRFRFKGTPRTIKSNLTEAEAQEHCSKDTTHGAGWFDGYDYMRGCAPKAR